MGTEGAVGSEPSEPFDFERHAKDAVSTYLEKQDYYRDLSEAVRAILEACINKRGVQVLSVQARAKSPTGLGRKAATPSEADPRQPKYRNPLDELTDLAAARVITFFPRTLEDIDRLLYDEFEIVERSDKGRQLIAEEKFGYQSIHYLVRLNAARRTLSEYERFGGRIVEVQVRTILQHAWAEIEHDIQYKSAQSIPKEIRRRFGLLAGMLEMADREFQAIQDDDRALKSQARKSVMTGQLDEVEITPDALKAFLDQKLGSDKRLTEFSYDWLARLTKSLGFQNLRQIEQCLALYDADKLSQVIWGGRQGQGTRFAGVLFAAMPEKYKTRHPYSSDKWFQDMCNRQSEALQRAGIKVGTYDPERI